MTKDEEQSSSQSNQSYYYHDMVKSKKKERASIGTVLELLYIWKGNEIRRELSVVITPVSATFTPKLDAEFSGQITTPAGTVI